MRSFLLIILVLVCILFLSKLYKYISLANLILKIEILRQEEGIISSEDETVLELLKEQFDDSACKENYIAYKGKMKEILNRSK